MRDKRKMNKTLSQRIRIRGSSDTIFDIVMCIVVPYNKHSHAEISSHIQKCVYKTR